MLLRFMNGLAGLFGYEWVLDTPTNTPPNKPSEQEASKAPQGIEFLEADEGWDDLHQHSPRYRLRKKSSS